MAADDTSRLLDSKLSITSQDEKSSTVTLVELADAFVETKTPPAVDISENTELCPPGRPPILSSLFSVERLTFIVTGGASGIGAAVCRELVQSGADLAIVDVDYTGATLLATQLVAASVKSNVCVKITAHGADVSASASINTVIEQILAQHGKIDRLVTCAGICENRAAVDYPHASMQRLWAINVDGTYLFATAVARHLIQRKAPGSLIFIGSMSGSVVNVPQKQTPYNMSKAAVRHMAASLAVEWAEADIRVNCVSPGYIQTPLTEKTMDQNPVLRQAWSDGAPMRRLGRPDEVVGTVLFLASNASSYVTGAEIRVDGGYTVV